VLTAWKYGSAGLDRAAAGPALQVGDLPLTTVYGGLYATVSSDYSEQSH
jgi:hypothetical protein